MNTVALDRIDRNPDQPRKHFDQAGLDELAGSIAELGLLQPIIIRPQGDRYQIIAGERRWRAANLAGLTEIPAIVVEADDDRTMVLAIAENVNRRDMNPIEEAGAYQALIDRGRTVEEVAQLFGKTPQTIGYRVDLLRLDPPLQHLAATGNLSLNLAWYMARLTVNGQYEVNRKLTRGELKTDDEATRYATAVYLRETQAELFFLEDPGEEHRAEVRSKVDRLIARIETAAGALEQIHELGDQLGALGGDLGPLKERLRILKSYVGRTQATVARYEAIVNAQEVAA
jgi:ParB/RepB/Spo0J family partition protein